MTELQAWTTAFQVTGSALTTSWVAKCAANSWDIGDVTFPNFSTDAPLDPNASDECKIKYLGYGIRLISRWLDCIQNGETETEIQTCVDNEWENFFLPGVDGCLAEA